MTQLMSITKAKNLSRLLTMGFLAIHIWLLLFFQRYHVTPMVFVNIGSVILYALMVIVISKGYLRGFAIAVYLEVVIHMCLAAFFTGWESGFQITLIGMGFLLFYSEYVGRFLQVPYLHALPLSLIGVAAYMTTLVVNHFIPEMYPLPEDVVFRLQIVWGLMVFGFSLAFLVTFLKLASASKELLSREVGRDKLTGLPNRYDMSDYLTTLVGTGSMEDYWAAIADLDYFKSINDNYGHNCGDYVLQQFAAILKNSSVDMHVCRWGGEEFLMVGKVNGDKNRTFAVIDKLRESVGSFPFRYGEQELKVTVTIGAAKYLEGRSVIDWINEADRMMYNGKNAGRNRVVLSWQDPENPVMK